MQTTIERTLSCKTLKTAFVNRLTIGAAKQQAGDVIYMVTEERYHCPYNTRLYFKQQLDYDR